VTTSSSLLLAKNRFVNQLATQPRTWMQILGLLSPYHRQSRRDPIQMAHLIELPGVDCYAHRDLQALARISEFGVELGTEPERKADSPDSFPSFE
jgi:hypothetical protein